MERNATNLEEAQNLFNESTEPVNCTDQEQDPKVCNTITEAEQYYSPGEQEEGYNTTAKSEGGAI